MTKTLAPLTPFIPTLMVNWLIRLTRDGIKANVGIVEIGGPNRVLHFQISAQWRGVRHVFGSS